MKFKKAAALLLAVSMAASFAGCSKVKSADMDTFIDACDEFDADEVVLDNFYDISPEDYEYGFYCVLDEDDIEELPTELLMMLKIYDLDLDLDFEDMERLAFIVSYDDLPNTIENVEEVEDILDVQTDLFGALQITLQEPANIDDMVDAIDDLLDHVHLEHEDLSSDEFKTTKNGLQMLLRIDIADYAAAFAESDAYDFIMDQADSDDADQLDDVLDEITGEVVLGIYIENENIVIVLGGAINEDNCVSVENFVGSLDLPNPSDMDSNQALIDSIIDMADDYASIYTSMMNDMDY